MLILERYPSHSSDLLVAAVGKLQFEVLQHRLINEYKAKSVLEHLQYRYGAWLDGDPDNFQLTSSSILAKDHHGRIIVLYSSEWEKNFLIERNPKHKFIDFI